MKKLASLALAFAPCAACAAPVLADETKTTTITFNHTDTNLNGTLHLSAAQLDPDHEVTISATEYELENQADNTKTIQFTLYEGSNSFTSTSFTDTKKEVQLSAHIDQKAWNAAPAGKYEGSVTFEISYNKKG